MSDVAEAVEPIEDHPNPEKDFVDGEAAGAIGNGVGVAHSNGDSDDDDDDECRVCRGPAEEGRPLYAPCKCSGSIGLTHQDCLMSWLEVTRKEGRCELCKTKFEFRPKYADDAPERLPAHEVLLGLSSRALAKWIPLALRILLAAAVWLIVAPLLTIYLYHAWMHRPSSVVARWHLHLIPNDIVSGIVVVIIILSSFLGLMSFADFLRIHWHQQRHRDGDVDDEDDNDDNNNEIFNVAGRNDLLPRQAPHVDPLVFGNGGDEDGNDNGGDEDNENNRANDTEVAAHIVDEILGDHGVNVGVDEGIIEHVRARRPRQRPSHGDGDTNENEVNDDSENDPADSDRDVGLIRSENNSSIEAGTVQVETVDDSEADDENAQQLEGTTNGNDNSDHLEVLPFFDRLLGPEEEEIGNDGSEVDVNHDDNNEGDDGSVADDMPHLAIDNDNQIGPRAAPGDGDVNNVQNGLVPPRGADDDARGPNGGNARRNGDRIDAFDPVDPLFQDDQLDMEINVALDELLGLRGPVGLLVRNLLWLLAFNATYLGLFAFIPRTIGSIAFSGFFNTTFCEHIVDAIPFVTSDDAEKLSLRTIISAVNEENLKQEASFRLSDVSTVALGYFTMATVIVIFRWIWNSSRGNRAGLTDDDQGDDVVINVGDNGQPDLDFFQRLDAQDINDPHDIDIEAHVAVGVALDAVMATVKVCILLFLKMMLLPFLLGVSLDASTISLFGDDVSDRTNFAGADLFSFALLHWVAGITFMLLVTVFLLQLREVAHPKVLARVIRPQEPQPDLLGNLMNETVTTHVKRMVLSLGIYAPLLLIYVYTPVKLFSASGLGSSFFRLHFWHPIMPQIQIPIELIMFHLSMLALLERYKNVIGEMQHRWLVFVCKQMDLTEYLLPREVQMFKLVGIRPVFIQDGQNIDTDDDEDQQSANEIVDPFWYKLACDDDEREKIITDSIKSSSCCPDELVVPGETKLNGSRVLSRTENYIRLPGIGGISDSSASDIQLLSTCIGRFRLKRERDTRDGSPLIQVWEEVPGKEIHRPPLGWDDLGAGGAFVQGRWAWGEEKMSVIERSVAHRVPFRSRENGKFPRDLVLRLTALVLLSWFAITAVATGVFTVPLAIGRVLYFLFRIPTKYMHDPLAFYVGSCLFFPLLSLVVGMFSSTLGSSSLQDRFRGWVSRFHFPSKSKTTVLAKSFLSWSIVLPFALGLLYDLFFVKSIAWFGGNEAAWDVLSLFMCWAVGSVLLNSWCFLAYFSVFTWSFWSAIGNGILEPPIDGGEGAPFPAVDNRGAAGDAPPQEEQEPVAGNDRQDTAVDHPHSAWQGKNGRVARFFSRGYRILTKCEWDLVDDSIFWDDFIFPIAEQIFYVLVGSMIAYQLSTYSAESIFPSIDDMIVVPFIGSISRGLFRLGSFRVCLLSVVLFQLCSSFRSPLRRWFEAAHKAARDDRYLVGEILMNHR